MSHLRLISKPSPDFGTLCLATCVLLLPVIGLLLYLPGLKGEFLFDDYNNLAQLGAYGGVSDWPRFWLYITSGFADPTGRPLSLLSFLLDANDWPADPEPFKLTNILIHLLNGCVLLWVMLSLDSSTSTAGAIRRQAAAILASAAWLLHPLWVSTTLYIIQREAQLSALFVLIGLLLWTIGRQRYLNQRRGGLLLLAAGGWGCSLLATLCKGNGILLPLLLIVLEATVLRGTEGIPLSFKRCRYLLLGIPATLIAIWLCLSIPHDWGAIAPARTWTYWQRLITEPRVLIDYLRLLWLPRPTLSGLFNDGYRASTDLLHPWTTLPCLFAVCGLFAAGIMLRRREPIIALAILFFFVGHLLESSFIALELYFEHRNYLPAIFLFWPLTLWLLAARPPAKHARYLLAAILIPLLTFLSWQRVQVWGSPREQADLFAEVSPDSPRAQVNASTYDLAAGEQQLAVARLWSAAARFPDEPQVTLNLVDAVCESGSVPRLVIDKAANSIRDNHFEGEFSGRWIVGHIPAAVSGHCKGIDLDTLQHLLDAIKANPNFSEGKNQLHDIANIEGQLALACGRGDEALRYFDEALSDASSLDSALSQAAMLGANGFPQQGLEHIAFFRKQPPVIKGGHDMAALHRWLLRRTGYWTDDLGRIEVQLQEDAAARSKNPVAGQP